MSFEGRYQLWCKGGHYDEIDVYAWPYDVDENGHNEHSLSSVQCSRKDCNEDIVFKNIVDDTNGEEAGYIIPEPLKSTQCECCGTCLETIYKIPSRCVK